MKLVFNLLLVLSLAAAGLTGFAQPVVAAEPTGFENVKLWVDPEYDDPRLLVMMEGEITGASVPAEVRFLVPAMAEMYSAGSKDAQGIYSGGPPNRKASDVPGWDEISYTLKYPTFRVEYYNDIIIGNPDKTISYDFRWLYPIRDLAVEFLRPPGATNFEVTFNGAQLQERGLGAFTVTQTNLTADPASQPLHFDVSYTKAGSALAATKPGDSSSSAGSSNSSGVMVAILIMLVILAIVGVFIVILLFQRNSKRATPRYGKAEAYNPNKRKQKYQSGTQSINRNAAVPSVNQNSANEQSANRNTGVVKSAGTTTHKKRTQSAQNCDQCGETVAKSERFCPNCGASME